MAQVRVRYASRHADARAIPTYQVTLIVAALSADEPTAAAQSVLTPAQQPA